MCVVVNCDEFFGICVFVKHATHRELTQHAILSEMACLTPFSDFNQSPRNMYQCQVCLVSPSTCHTS